MLDSLPDLIGFVGVLITLVAYLLLQINYYQVSSIPYSLANAIGSVLILYSLYFHWNISCVIIETFWLGISIFGVIKVLFKRRH